MNASDQVQEYLEGMKIIKSCGLSGVHFKSLDNALLATPAMEGKEKEVSNCDIELQVKDVLAIVYRALSEKGYNPLNQIVGYIMSGDPTYITSHNNARSLIMKVERDELVEEVLKAYIKNNHWN